MSAVQSRIRTSYRAFYEDANKCEARAKARGFTGKDGESWHDFVEAGGPGCRTGKSFSTLREAVTWLRAEVRAMKTVYGASTIRLIETVERRDQCRYCVCGGARATHEWTVTDDGIEEDVALDYPCLGDDE